MIYQEIEQDMERVKDHFHRMIQSSNFLFDGGERILSWRKYQRGIDKDTAYSRIYQRLVDERQYSFLLIDNSLIQLYYRFSEGDQLLAAKLAYFPPPPSRRHTVADVAEQLFEAGEFDAAINMLELDEEGDISDVPGDASSLRFDFDSKVTTHCKSHLQISTMNDLRIPMSAVLTPMLFIEFIVEQAPGLSEAYRALADRQNFIAARKVSAGLPLVLADFSSRKVHLHIDLD